MICQGSTCNQGRESCKSPKLCLAMNAPVTKDLGGGTFYPPVKTLKRVERFSLRFFVALVIGVVVWAILLNWPLLRWALN